MEKKTRIQELIDDVNLLRKCVALLWKKRMVYVIYVTVGIILSLIISFSMPKVFSSSVTLAPEPQGDELSSGFSDLAGLANISMGEMGVDAYTIDLYPKIVSSVDFGLALGEINVKSSKMGIETTYSDYLLKYYKYPWWKCPVIWVNSLIAKVFSDTSDNTGGGESDGPRHITKKDYAVCGRIKENVRFSVEQQVGIVSVKVFDFDPEIAAIVADSVVTRLNNFILDYRTAKARKQYEYAVALCDSAHKSYMDVQEKFVKYALTHNSIYSPAQKAEFDFLEKEVALAYQSYSTAVSQKQFAQAKVLESTPVYTVIESAYVPLFADSPNKVFILIVFVVLSCVAATFRILYSEIFAKK